MTHARERDIARRARTPQCPSDRNSHVQAGSLPEATGLIQMRDYGPGVPQADLEKIFLPFYRVNFENHSDSGGSGLGLAITERIIRMHGGAVRATNAPDGGLLVDWNFLSAHKVSF